MSEAVKDQPGGVRPSRRRGARACAEAHWGRLTQASIKANTSRETDATNATAGVSAGDIAEVTSAAGDVSKHLRR